MRRNMLLASVVGLALPLLAALPANAQATRTWISGVGDDANPCSRTAPCKTFAGAISKTAAGGEIDVLDPGGFGALTITKSITLDGGGGQVASVLVAGTNGIVVSAGSNDVVILRNLRFQGLLGNAVGTNPGLSAIRFLAGAQLTVDNCDIYGFSVNGVDIASNQTSTTVIRNSTFRNITGNGVNATTSAGSAIVAITGSSFNSPYKGAGAIGNGVTAAANSTVSVTESQFHGFAIALGTSGAATLNVDRSFITTSGTGINVAAGGTVNASGNTLVGNTNAFNVAGTLSSSGTNVVQGPTGNPNGSAVTLK